MLLGIQMKLARVSQQRTKMTPPLPNEKACTTKMDTILFREGRFLCAQLSSFIINVAPSTTMICINRWVENIRLNVTIIVGQRRDSHGKFQKMHL